MKQKPIKIRAASLGLTVAFLALQGCNKSFHDVGTPPQLTQVGYELPMQDILIAEEPQIIRGPDRVSMADNGIWNQKDSIYFKDTRAYEVGDILTVTISINDSASLNNSSGRKTEVEGSLGASSDITVPLFGELPSVDATGNLATGLELDRSGTVTRTERIELQVAAAVIGASSNGNLRIIGNQEIRVNHELRILTVQGIVRSKDILPDNTIPYEKIAEARITYGGHNSRKVPKPKRNWNPLKRGFGKPIIETNANEQILLKPQSTVVYKG